MTSDTIRADETSLSIAASSGWSGEWPPATPSLSPTAAEQREAVWLEWEQNFLTQLVLHSDGSFGARS